jgi:type VI secretion system FHA domain protein
VDVWGKLAGGNAVDWSRGGFGPAKAEPLAPAPAHDPFGLSTPATPVAPSRAIDPFGAAPTDAPPAATIAPQSSAWGAAPVSSAPAAPAWGAVSVGVVSPPAPARVEPPPLSPPPLSPPPPMMSAPPATDGGAWPAFLAGAGLSAGDVKADPQAALNAAGALLKRLVGGMVMMLEARARAKAQLGAQATALEFDGNNPLKFARSPERALAQLLAPPERGFMSAERAVEDGFRDLQAHQMATLVAMQGALAATLARFSPQAIRERATMRGLLAKIVPSAREAELWKAYEKEFEGVARGSDEAFMDVFAKQFRIAYETAAADLKARR